MGACNLGCRIRSRSPFVYLVRGDFRYVFSKLAPQSIQVCPGAQMGLSCAWGVRRCLRGVMSCERRKREFCLTPRENDGANAGSRKARACVLDMRGCVRLGKTVA